MNENDFGGLESGASDNYPSALVGIASIADSLSEVRV